MGSPQKFTYRSSEMACPFFMPIAKSENGSWLHVHRLPLGCGWSGQCTAPGHEGESPSQEELQEFCNLGYAGSCTRIPQERAWDSVRFGVKAICIEGQKQSERIQLRFVCERDHRPVESGLLEFDAASGEWRQRHADARVQRMAECYLATYVEKRKSHAELLVS
jgi:hypothetical protein